jgi:hypothetical protein
MLTASLIIARAVHIAACILIAGIFTFEMVVLGAAELRTRADCAISIAVCSAWLSGVLSQHL